MTRRLRRLAALVALVGIPALGLPAAAQAPERQLGLDDAIQLALENNDDLRIERESLSAATAAATGAHGAYDPLLSIEGDWERSRLPVNSSFSGAPAGELSPTTESTSASARLSQLLPTGGSLALTASEGRGTSDNLFQLLSPAYDSSLGVELRQPLLRDRSIDPARFGLRVAAADRDRAAAGLERQVADTVAAVERAYWSLVAARRGIAVREEAVHLAEEQQSETDARIATGAAPETEAAQPRSELERRRGDLLAAREASARAENALKLLILGDSDSGAWSQTLVPSESAAPEVEPVDLAAALDRALAARPELAENRAAVERRRAETDLARDAVRPSLDLVVGYDRYGLAGTIRPAAELPGVETGSSGALAGGWRDSVDFLRTGEFHDGRVGLVFSVPLGNRQARAGVAVARSAESQARAGLARARKRVRSEVLDAAAALDTARQRIEAARAAREAAEVQLAAERDRYQAGLSTNFLVLTRQNDLSSARLEEIAAQTDYRQAATEMARATGNLLVERGIRIDSQNVETENDSTRR